jgi:hypothetical protein
VDLAVPLLRLLAELALVRGALLRLAAAPLEREEPLLERDALGRLRVDAADFDRDELLAFGFERDAFEERFEAFDELLLLLLRLAAGLLLAIPETSRLEGVFLRLPVSRDSNQIAGDSAAAGANGPPRVRRR